MTTHLSVDGRLPILRADLTMTSGRDHTPAEHEGAVMDDEWHALEHYLLTRIGRTEGARAEPPEPPVTEPPMTRIPTVDPDDTPALPATALEVRRARG